MRCPHCNEYRDPSNRYTSPANARRDAEAWKGHEAGMCATEQPRRTSWSLPVNVAQAMHAWGVNVPISGDARPQITLGFHQPAVGV